MYFWRICNLIASTNQKTYILRGLAKHAYIFQTTTLIISHYRDTIAGRPSQQKKLEKKIVMQNLVIDVKVSLLYASTIIIFAATNHFVEVSFHDSFSLLCRIECLAKAKLT